MAKVQEVIVVEGKSDTQRLKAIMDVDTIETNGSAIDQETLALIKKAQAERGVIVFTDPDFPGEKIRKTIMEMVPEARHAFISQEEARNPNLGSLGVEHASDQAIIQALQAVHYSYLTADDQSSDISPALLRDLKLVNGPGAKVRRQVLGQVLRIGYSNGKQLKKRLDMFGIGRDQLVAAVEKINEGKTDE